SARGWKRWLGEPPAPAREVRLLPEGRSSSLEDRLKEAIAKRAAAAECDPPPGLIILAQRFGLVPFVRDTLLLCAAMEVDPAMASLCAPAQGAASRTSPTFALALQAFDDPTWDALSAHRPLRYARFVDISFAGPAPLTSSPLRADERIVNFLKGL